jgi:hypothetical protein
MLREDAECVGVTVLPLVVVDESAGETLLPLVFADDDEEFFPELCNVINEAFSSSL